MDAQPRDHYSTQPGAAGAPGATPQPAFVDNTAPQPSAPPPAQPAQPAAPAAPVQAAGQITAASGGQSAQPGPLPVTPQPGAAGNGNQGPATAPPGSDSPAVPVPQNTPSQDAEDAKKPYKIHYPTRLFALALFNLLSLLFILLLTTHFTIDLPTIILTAFATVLNIITWLLPAKEIDRWFQGLLNRLYDVRWLSSLRICIAPLLYRKDFFISYHEADRQWYNWIIWQLEQAGYQVMGSDWNGEGYAAEMSNAMKQAKRTLTLLSPDYVAMLQRASAEGTATQDHQADSNQHPRKSADEWWQMFLKRNSDGKRDIAVLVRRYKLPFTPAVDLVISNRDMARDRLFAKLPRPPEIHPPASDDPSAPPFPLAQTWKMPARYDRPFTGRETFLQDLSNAMTANNGSGQVLLVAMTGMEGVGKTRTAFEYALQYKTDYAHVYWIDASTEAQLRQSFIDWKVLASTSTTPADDVKAWLTSLTGRWLLIFDGCRNLPDLDLIRTYLPNEDGSNGHVLITTDNQAIGAANGVAHIELPLMEQQEAALFLLRCANQPPQQQEDHQRRMWEQPLLWERFDEKDREQALYICTALLDRLPLAIEQAGAYIAQMHMEDLQRFSDLYQQQSDTVLRYCAPDTRAVATTWKLAIESCQKETRALLSLCAYLSSSSGEPVPEEIVSNAPDLGSEVNTFQGDSERYNNAVGEAHSFSLLHRDYKQGDKDRKQGYLVVHRLVLEVLREQLYADKPDPAEQKAWAERALKAMCEAFPVVTFENWETCKRYLPSALACIQHARRYAIISNEAIRLFYATGIYLRETGNYVGAQSLLEDARRWRAEFSDVCYPDWATCENGIAELYRMQGRYKEAEGYYLEALKHLSPSPCAPANVDEAAIHNNLGRLYEDWGRLDKAEKQFIAARKLYEDEKQTGSADYAVVLSNLAGIDLRKENIEEAGKKYEQARGIFSTLKLLENHPYVSHYYANYATLCVMEKKYAEAEMNYKRAIESCKQALGAKHPQLAIRHNNLGEVYRVQGRNGEAEQCYADAIKIYEEYKQQTGMSHPSEPYVRKNLTIVLKKPQGLEEMKQNEKLGKEQWENHYKANQLEKAEEESARVAAGAT
jgi:tetratricopeptide (TPR) repeat protein